MVQWHNSKYTRDEWMKISPQQFNLKAIGINNTRYHFSLNIPLEISFNIDTERATKFSIAYNNNES